MGSIVRISHRLGLSGILGAILLFTIILASVLAPLLSQYSPDSLAPKAGLSPPSPEHWLGTDELGRDIWTRILYGGRISLGSALTVVLLSAIIGSTIGVVSGLMSKSGDQVVMRTVDVFLAFPPLLLAMAVSAALGAGLQNAIIAIVMVWWAGYARIARGQVLVVKEMPYIAAARSLGIRSRGLAMRHVVPNILTPIVIKASTDIGFAVLTLASLSFIGLGTRPPAPEWGAMISSGSTYILDYWWYPFAPGLAIFFTVLSTALLGDALRDVLDPRH